MSIRWIRNVAVDGKPSTLEVMLGWVKIADKCYIRVGNEDEYWFRPGSDNRESILEQGIALLQNRLQGRSVTTPTGSPYSWN
jgi:hypothetical protein